MSDSTAQAGAEVGAVSNSITAVRLYMLKCGTLKTEGHMISLNQGLGQPFEVPVPWYLITHPRGHVIIDGGNAPQVAVDAEAHWGAAVPLMTPTMVPDEAVLPQLEALGVDPASVRWIIQSHLHLDHSGAVAVAEHFHNAQVLITRAELEYARSPDWFAAMGYITADFARDGIEWVLLEAGDDGYDVFGDGVLRCHFTPGHSPGHMSFTVELPETGTVMLTSDAAYTLAHWENRALPTSMTSALEVVRSVAKLRRLADRHDALVVTGHDPDAWPTFRHAPEFYA